ncbi:hypothetical protein cce_4775 [Crocosphaera subtropica ATCC 51142]|uniref:DUF4126 domain-containing protein n=1 Tax=Crocosphaera subtropica (strain ATCC 51142 / BH68) TaxID=43989 RepID=B1X1W2_CROS5|nr:DUF4126 domain-containing protein [Crocosphaera subtropica]ACB54123.1 hypothetical protein cce_4775 [Crocosphaera subtropica ATCC 51142]
MESLVSLFLGLALSASCGFRVFVPLLIISIGAVENWITLPEDLLWLDSNQAIILFSVASLVEVILYYFPWLDNALDMITLPLASIVGIWVTQSYLPEMTPLAQWTLAIIAGGGTAGITKTLNSLLRVGSTATTGGLSNPIFSTIELIGATIIATMGMIIPVAMGVVIICILILGVIKAWFWWKNPKRLDNSLLD